MSSVLTRRGALRGAVLAAPALLLAGRAGAQGAVPAGVTLRAAQYKAGDQLLQVSGISKTVDGEQVLKNVSFTLKRGDKVALVGPNGIGKTMLFKILMGEETADEGTFKWGVSTSTSLSGRSRVTSYAISMASSLTSSRNSLDTVSLLRSMVSLC